MKMTKKGFTLVELLVVIGILGILMAALFPAISSAMLAAKTSACQMQGTKLFKAIIQANVEREPRGLPSVWPKSNNQKSDDSDDIAGQQFNSSTEYFKELFDIENYGKDEWEPYADVDLSVLYGFGVPSFSGTDIQPKNVMWCIASGLTDEMSDIIPALVTRNCDVAKLETKQFDGSTKTQVGVGKANGGESDSPFANKVWIVVRKGGAAEAVKSRYSKLYLIYNQQSFTVSDEAELEYLKVGM